MKSQWLVAFLAVLTLAGCGGGVVSESAATAAPGESIALAPPAPPPFPDLDGRTRTAEVVAPAAAREIPLKAGFNMVSFPVAQVTSVTAGPGVDTRLWSFAGGVYSLVNLVPAEINAGSGTARGFWIFSSQASSLYYEGTTQGDGATRKVTLEPGFNLIGVPLPFQFTAGNARVSVDGQAFRTLTSSTCLDLSPVYPSGCAVYRSAFSYAEGGYEVLDLSSSSTVFQPQQAAWVYARAAAVLELPLYAHSATVPVGFPSDMLSSLDGTQLYALDQVSNELVVFDAAQRREIRRVGVGALPRRMALTPDGAALVVANAGATSLTVVNLADFSTRAVWLPGIPGDVAPDDDGTAWTSYNTGWNSYTSFLARVDLQTGGMLGSWSVTRHPDLLELDRARDRLYAGESGGSFVVRYGVATGVPQQEQAVQLGFNGRDLDLSPDGAHLTYAAGGGNLNFYGYVVALYDSLNLSSVLGSWNIGTYPQGVAFDPDGSRIYAVNSDDLNVAVGRTSDFTRLTTFPVPGGTSDDVQAVAITRDRRTLAVSTFNEYDETNGRVHFFATVMTPPAEPGPAPSPSPSPAPVYANLGALPLADPEDMLTTADGRTLIVLDADTNEAILVDTELRREVARVPVGSMPQAMDLTPDESRVVVAKAGATSLTVVDLGNRSTTIVPLPRPATDVVVDGAGTAWVGLQTPSGSTDHQLVRVDLQTGEATGSWPLPESPSVLAVDRPRNLLLVGGFNSLLRYRLEAAGPVQEETLSPGLRMGSLTLSPDGESLIRFANVSSNFRSSYVSACRTTALTTLLGSWYQGTHPSYADFSPDGSRIYGFTSFDSVVHVVSASTWAPVTTFSVPTGYYQDLERLLVSADGGTVFVTSDDGAGTGQVHFFRVP